MALFHLSYWQWAAPDSTPGRLLGDGPVFAGALGSVSVGWVGVEIFFVISGFVIAYSANGVSPMRFAESRTLRLVPGGWVCALIAAGAIVATGVMALDDLAGPLARSLAFWPTGPWIDGVYWTLGVEIVFYALVFGILCLNQFARIEAVAVALGVVSALAWSAWLMTRHPVLHNLLAGRLGQLTLLSNGCQFALGLVFWRVMSKSWNWSRALLVLLCVVGSAIEVYSGELDHAERARQIPHVASAIGLWLVGVAAIWASFQFNATVSRAFGRLGGLVRTIGLATYPFYLLHDPIGAGGMAVGMRLGLPPTAALAVGLALAAAMSIGVATYLEPALRPMLAAIFRGISRRLPQGSRLLVATSTV
ncbi:MAG: acyltransferase [Caulobacter sp.]|nr:acyltransferase [Caulobacter sp.]